MFKNTYQSGLLSIFYSCGSNPLAIWDMEVKNGHIKRLTDNEVNSIVLEIVSTNVATTFITCPKRNQVLGIKLPFLVMIVKNLKRYFSFEITIVDDKNMRRRFRISNFQSTTKIKPFCTCMPIGLSGGWNQIQFNLADFTRRAYGTQFIEVQRVQVHANARLRRIYFSERLYTEEELPQDYKLYLPMEKKSKKAKQEKKEEETAKKIPAQPPVTAAPVEVVAEPPVESKVSAATIPPPVAVSEEKIATHTESVVEIIPETVVVEVSSKEGEETISAKVEGEENNEPTAEEITEIKPDEDMPVEE
ncbi:cilia- and flagella-associated protein 20-like [Vanessa cardui]|uniref:cilia- and flagella-associated protein 20-like n=1 Tax=Vanessa cardui TaxID=171605 RepID=UPI001F14245D|nr:cilia- and flagella-associated protein 20-like [Vanessa cardui]